MKHLKLNLGLTLVSVLAVGVLAAAPASAEHGTGSGSGSGKPATSSTSGSTTTVKADDSTHTETTSTSGRNSSRSGTKTETEHGTEAETETEHAGEHVNTTGKVDDLRLRAQQLLAIDRQGKKSETSVADRQKACEARQAHLNTKITNYGSQASRHLTSLNTTYDKIKAYQAEKQLTVADYDTLVAAADAQKATAAAAVDALKTVTVEIDCTSTDPAASVATVKTAVKNAHSALQDYRGAIKKVLIALITAKKAAATDNSTEGTN